MKKRSYKYIPQTTVSEWEKRRKWIEFFYAKTTARSVYKQSWPWLRQRSTRIRKIYVHEGMVRTEKMNRLTKDLKWLRLSHFPLPFFPSHSILMMRTIISTELNRHNYEFGWLKIDSERENMRTGILITNPDLTKTSPNLTELSANSDEDSQIHRDLSRTLRSRKSHGALPSMHIYCT